MATRPLGRQIRDIKRRQLNKAYQVVRKTMIDIANEAIFLSPVDKGNFRSRWNVGFDSIPPPATGGPDPTGQATLSRVTGSLLSGDVSGFTFVTNSSAQSLIIDKGLYPNPPKRGSYLKAGQTKGGFVGPGFFRLSQNGFSKQAPAGIVDVTVAKFRPIAEDAIRSIARQR